MGVSKGFGVNHTPIFQNKTPKQVYNWNRCSKTGYDLKKKILGSKNTPQNYPGYTPARATDSKLKRMKREKNRTKKTNRTTSIQKPALKR